MKSLFFRLAKTSYKKKSYVYLKLMESRRKEGGIRHQQLAGLPGVGKMPEDSIHSLMEDLNETLALYREISRLARPWRRNLKLSYILAMEKAFQLNKTSTGILAELLTGGGKGERQNGGFNSKKLFGLIRKKSLQFETPKFLICWLENKNCFLMDSNGFPLKFIFMDQKKKDELAMESISQRIGDKAPEFFLTNTCELLYNYFLKNNLGEKGYSLKEVFLYRRPQCGNTGKDARIEKILMLSGVSSRESELMNQCILAVNNLRDNIDYVDERLKSVKGSNPVSDHDIAVTYFFTIFFNKLFSRIKTKYNFQI
ncbi:MAG: hypothetical protein ACOY31_12795 [Bacillota bacterium]